MVTERRFAIVIGINDYEKSPLDYCANDAESIKNILIEKCCFQSNDVHLIISNKDKPIKDISGHLEAAIKIISTNLRAGEDSLFFYFAGHGQFHFERSGLLFHDSITEIIDIYTKLNELQPKYQCYVIDACESGGKVLTRGTKKTDLIENYISKSNGILFMYATTENEKAKELEHIKHGLFTYYFLKAVSDESIYDTEGVLTPNRIQDFIARETSKESQFKQTPVIENRTAGYYPFAFKNRKQEFIKTEQEIPIKKKESMIDKEYFPVIPPEIRNNLFSELKPLFEEKIKQCIPDIKDYEITFGDSITVIGSNVEDKITDSISEMSRKENVIAMNRLFSYDRIENKPNKLAGVFSMLDAMSGVEKPKYTYINRILWGDEKLVPFFVNFKSTSITKVSCGIVVLAYQAVYGVGFASSGFYFEYTGIGETEIHGPFTEIKPYKVNSKTINNILNNAQDSFKHFLDTMENWNSSRAKDISAFDNKAI